MAKADIHIKLGDIKGESTDDKHKDEIDVESFSWGASNPGSMSHGGGGGTGRVSFSDLTFVHHASLNSFVATTLRTTQRGEVARWRPRCGTRPIL